MSNKIEDLEIDFSFKKNNVDELFFNLSENPEGFKNKDFRYTLSMIYQIIEDGSGVQTAILVFDKLDKKDGGGTDQVWLYNMEADGFSLDDKRNEVKDNDIPDIITRFNNLEAEKDRTAFDKSFFVSID